MIHQKPKILVIDFPDAVTDVLAQADFNVLQGTFGTPYVVDRSGNYFYVPRETCRLPNLDEQEILIVNVDGPEPDPAPIGEPPGPDVRAIWQKGSTGVIDPRPFNMRIFQDSFVRTVNFGGLLIVVMGQQEIIKYISAPTYSNGDINHHKSTELEASNWSFHPAFGRLDTSARYGNEVSIDRDRLLKPYDENLFSYKTIFSERYKWDETFFPLASNKYGEPVSALFLDGDNPILLLPQIENIEGIIVDLVKDTGYALRPNLFPMYSKAAWLSDPRYEIPEATVLLNDIDEIQKETNKRIEEIQEEIVRIKNNKKYLHVLLNGTGDELVQAVIQALKDIGFINVIDVDDEIKNESGDEGDSELMEDIRVQDVDPWLIIDVKGIAGLPDDDESRQAEKHTIMRMKEWDKTGLKALTIINHQRQIPPHERDQVAYREKIIGAAELTDLGLMTTWDLYQIRDNMLTLGWTKENVHPIFLRAGRISCTPAHYRELGVVEHIWEKAIGIRPRHQLKIGDRIAYNNVGIFYELEVSSMMIDDTPVEIAEPETDCGIGIETQRESIKKGTTIYLIGSSDQE